MGHEICSCWPAWRSHSITLDKSLFYFLLYCSVILAPPGSRSGPPPRRTSQCSYTCSDEWGMRRLPGGAMTKDTRDRFHRRLFLVGTPLYQKSFGDRIVQIKDQWKWCLVSLKICFLDFFFLAFIPHILHRQDKDKEKTQASEVWMQLRELGCANSKRAHLMAVT